MMQLLVERILPKNKTARMLLLLFIDVLIILFSSLMGLLVRFDFSISRIPMTYALAVLRYLLPNIIITLFVFKLMDMYSSMWTVAGVREAVGIITACVASSLLMLAGMVMTGQLVPRSFYPIYGVCLTGCELLVRLSYRISRTMTRRQSGQAANRILVVGAGSSGSAILKETIECGYVNNDRIVCFVDDNPNKVGKTINGVPIEGNRYDIPALVKKHGIHKIYLAMPAASPVDRKAILEICHQTSCQLKTLPGIYQLLNGEVSVSKLRDVQIEDLLGREQVETNLNDIMRYIKNKVILVTGGGGSIGSELCRQIANHNPKQLIIFDIYENNAYQIQQELQRIHPDLNLVVLIGSVRNRNRLESVFSAYRPQIVFHAAAHKHVPLMEDSPCEAVKNNVFGTYKTAMMADRFETEKFVLISTDKAVNPTNIMGASKRICEMIIQTLNFRSKTEYVAVRFGNVLGSNGSVIPLFKKQIARGGPVTVTHPDIVRFFMTIPEAVSLVLQAGAYAKGGEIFVLDMGEPVKIDDMARNLIKLSGYTPDLDIKIEYTGLRPGEKLYEEILMDEEGLKETENHRIHIGRPIKLDEDWFLTKLQELDEASYEESAEIKALVHELVPEYRAADVVNAEVEAAFTIEEIR